MLDDQVVGCEEAVVVGGTAAAAKGLTNAATVFAISVWCFRGRKTKN